MFGRKVFSTKLLAATAGLAMLAASPFALETMASGNSDLNKLNALSKLIQARLLGIDAIISGESTARAEFDDNMTHAINVMYTTGADLGTSLAQLPAMMDTLEDCASDPTCIRLDPAKAPSVTIVTKSLYGGESSCVDWWLNDCSPHYRTLDLNLPISTWQYCAITGGVDSENKQHQVYKNGSPAEWWLRMEQSQNDKDWNPGWVYATCFSMTKK